MSGRIFEGADAIGSRLVNQRKPVTKAQAKDLLRELFDLIGSNIDSDDNFGQENWLHRRKIKISDHNPNPETLLEKAVALLAENGHMPEWYNQMPIASRSGANGALKDRAACIDLAYIPEDGQCAELIELKWKGDDPVNDNPAKALIQILEYGLAYLFFRVHVEKYKLADRKIMQASHVVLKVVAPPKFFESYDLAAVYDSLNPALNDQAMEKTSGDLSMSLAAKMLPSSFQHPFKCGAEVKESCDKKKLTPGGKGTIVCDAFENLVPAKWG